MSSPEEKIIHEVVAELRQDRARQENACLKERTKRKTYATKEEAKSEIYLNTSKCFTIEKVGTAILTS